MAAKKKIPVGIARLRRLAVLVEGLPSARFDMGNWSSGKNDWDGFMLRFYSFAPATCGTTACAGGWATTIPEFQLAGFTLDGSGNPKFKEHVGMRACKAFFSVPGFAREVENLFQPNEDDRKNTPAAVARNIRRLIAKAT